jgi:two-component system, OmpR family, sensor histidine kinase PhoQ
MNKRSICSQTLLPQSIMGRLLIASLVLLPLFCGLLGLSLDRAFTQSLRSSLQTQLTLQVYTLIAAADFDQQKLWFPEQLTDDRLNQPSSELFAVVFSINKDEPVWKSPSAINQTIPETWQRQNLKTGQSNFSEINSAQGDLFYLQYNVFWEDDTGVEHPFQFVVFESQSKTRKQISSYRQSLWGWLTAIALSITIIQILILKWGLKPIHGVARDLKYVQQGQVPRLDGYYPSELKEMTDSINTLLSNEAQQRTRYKNTMSDLAHSLKTPLAIMQGSLHKPGTIDTIEIKQQINRIDQIISYQLKRTISAPANPFSSAHSIKENCEKVVSALQKVYREKNVNVTMDLPEKMTFLGDKGDLLEILGNILDNAFKYGEGEIHISGKYSESRETSICIEDNGHGITEENRRIALQRGERADTSLPGQGIGLSVVTDIISSYKGSIKLAKSPLGGLAVTFKL